LKFLAGVRTLVQVGYEPMNTRSVKLTYTSAYVKM